MISHSLDVAAIVFEFFVVSAETDCGKNEGSATVTGIPENSTAAPKAAAEYPTARPLRCLLCSLEGGRNESAIWTKRY